MKNIFSIDVDNKPEELTHEGYGDFIFNKNLKVTKRVIELLQSNVLGSHEWSMACNELYNIKRENGVGETPFKNSLIKIEVSLKILINLLRIFKKVIKRLLS